MFRIPNLLIIALTFLVLRHLLFVPVFAAFSLFPGMGTTDFLIMVVSTVLIAASGYISNDYFDVVTDTLNKPERQYIGKQISPALALTTSILLSFAAIVLAIILSFACSSWLPGGFLITALAVTWWYALQLKRTLLWGNIAVSCMSAGTIAMAWIIEKQISAVPPQLSAILTKAIVAVSIFAFLLSLLREIVKDIEDIDGDSLINCKSLPIIKGITFTKTVLFALTSVTLVLLIAAQIYMLKYSLLMGVFWLVLTVEIPLLYFICLLKNAEHKVDFHKLSTLLKWVMLGGIGSIFAGQF